MRCFAPLRPFHSILVFPTHRTYLIYLCYVSPRPFIHSSKGALTMPPKREFNGIPHNAISANTYTDASGNAPNKRSRIANPPDKVFTNSTALTDATARISENGTPGDDIKNREGGFDHSRPEERAGIVDRRYYPAEMSNERCAMYNVNEIPRPIAILEKTLKDTKQKRDKIQSRNEGGHGDAVMHWFKRDLRIRDNTGLSKAAELAKSKGIGLVTVWIMSPQDWEAHLVRDRKSVV